MALVMMNNEGEGRDSKDGDANPDANQAKEHFRQGVVLLFQAAFEAANGLKKELDRSGLTTSVENAGKEFVRAAGQVKQRFEEEFLNMSNPNQKKRVDPQDPEPWADQEETAKKKEKPKGPTDSDPGFWMANEGEDQKKK